MSQNQNKITILKKLDELAKPQETKVTIGKTVMWTGGTAGKKIKRKEFTIPEVTPNLRKFDKLPPPPIKQLIKSVEGNNMNLVYAG